MDRNENRQGSEDNTQNVEHVENAAENRDALAAQARRTEATTPEATNVPIGSQNSSGAAQDRDNVEAMRAVEENRDALREQNRRTAATTPDDINMTGPDRSGDRNNNS